jgi:NAD+ diphosphatase
VFLGLVEGQALFALDISAAEEDPAKQGPLAGLGLFKEMRPAALVLPAEDTAILGQAKALIDWHQRHGFCPNCGHATRMEDGGYRRTCPHCGAEHFPRVDPVVIMLPVLDDRCLLGHNRRFVDGLYSAFAGFIEPGETVEEAVARELAEEAGVAVEKVTYHSSQAWPFPSALMIGCYAKVASREIAIDGKEITDARWMTRQELRERLAGRIKDGVSLPIPIAIAHHLIKDWAEDF